MSPASGTRPPARRRELTFVLALFVVASALMPLAHHDLVCHLKSTTHCTTCHMGFSADAAADVAAIFCVTLDDVGAARVEPSLRAHGVSVLAQSGRAPPSFA